MTVPVLRQALATLLRGGQRVAVAVLAVAFGVATLTAMLLLTGAIGRVVTVSPRLQQGGDVLVSRAPDDSLRAVLRRLEGEGLVDDWAEEATLDVLLGQSGRSGRLAFVARVRAVEAARFPLLGRVALAGGGSFARALAAPGAAVVTRDVAEALALAVGDTLRLSAGGGLVALQRVVTGIARDTPDHFGSGAFVALGSVPAAAASETRVLVRTAQPEKVAAALGAGAEALPAEKPLDRSMRFFLLMLRGAGLLGLAVGGIGIANTVAVLLAGRRTEIAVRKTIGYPAGQLYLLFGLEAAGLGLAGGLAGAALGWALAGGLLGVLSASLPLLTAIHFDGGVLLLGAAAGVVVAVLFSAMPIARAAGVRPITLLRDARVRRGAGQRGAEAGLALAVAVFFWLLCALVMGGLVPGAVVVATVAGGFVVFGGGLLLLLFLFARVPLPGVPLARMARRNAARGSAQTAFVLVALFAGFFAIGIALVSLRNATTQRDARAPSRAGYNLSITTLPADTAAVRALLARAGADSIRARVVAPAAYVERTGNPWPIKVEASALPPGTAARGTPLLSREDTAVVVLLDGQARTYRLAAQGRLGRPGLVEMVAQPPADLRLPRADVEALAGRRVAVTAQVPPPALKATARTLVRHAPQRAVLTVDEVAAFFDLLFLALFKFALAVASLALVAGVVLVANGVTLALVTRRREIGVLKSVGYARRHVLRMLAYEYGGMGALAVAVAVGAVAAGVLLIEKQSGRDLLMLGPALTLALGATGIALPVGAVYAAGWRAAGRRPLDTLRVE